jgi:hypothetical protein
LGKDVSKAGMGVREAFDVLTPLAEELGIDVAVEGVFGTSCMITLRSNSCAITTRPG